MAEFSEDDARCRMHDREFIVVREQLRALGELLDQRIAHERELTLAGFGARDEALRRQAVEYEHRLTVLNGNMEQTIKDRKELFSRTAHEDFVKHLSLWQENVNRDLTTIRTWGTAGLFMLALVEFGLRFLWK